MRPIHFLILLMMGIFISCESLVTNVSPDKLPDTKAKLVVQSFISPQADKINVVVSMSTPIFGETSGSGSVIKTALVKIYDGNKEITIPYDSTTQLYSTAKANFKISTGQTYLLSVTDGDKTVTSSCTIPLKTATIQSYVIDTIYTSTGTQRDSTLTVKMTWQDIVGEANYYRIRAYIDLEYSTGEGTTAATFRERRVRNRLNFRWDRTLGRNDLQSDVNLDGEIFTSPIGRATLPETQSYNLGEGVVRVVNPRTKVISFNIEVDNTDSDYYKYHRSLELSDSENPFSEPALIFTNITNGLGCFAAYNSGILVYRPQ